jgi:serine/threonine-protein kinase
MPDDPRLADLLLRWEELRDQGQSVSAEKLCVECPELLPELRRRIQALVSLESMLRTEPAAPGMEALSQTPGELPELPGYEVQGVLGQGGMGVVYQARQQSLGRPVAIKMVPPETKLRPEVLARFRREAETIARLQHPNILQVYDVGEYDGRPFVALEFVGGGSLAEKLGGKPQPPREAAEVVETLARALHHAHERGVIHRDLKPGNILLTEDGTLKVSDFGLAKSLLAAGRLTRTGTVLGTPCYMAPEQATGRGHEVGPAADVYGLGAILYQALTGRPPFYADSEMETLRQVTEDEPSLPSLVVPGVPADLEAICLRCLEKDPAQRYPSALALAEDLARFRHGERVQARPARWWRRSPNMAALVLAVVLALMTGLALWAYLTSLP